MPAAAATAAKSTANRNPELIRYINLKLAALGQPTSRSTADPDFLEIAGPLLRNYHQKDQLLGDRLCPADARIQAFLDSYFGDVCPRRRSRVCPPTLSCSTAPGLARDHVAAPERRQFPSPYLQVLSRPAGRAAQSQERPPHHARNLSTSSKADCRFRPTKSPFPSRLSRPCWRAALQPAGQT